MRLCNGYYYQYANNTGFTEFSNGKFHRWGENYEIKNNTVIPITVAIVELEDGKIIIPAADMIQFINVNEAEWHDEVTKPQVNKWVVVRDSDGKEYTDHQWAGHAWYDYCRGMDGTCFGWRTDVDVVSWRYQEE